MTTLEAALLAEMTTPEPPYRAEVIARSQARLARYLERRTLCQDAYGADRVNTTRNA